MSKKTFKDVLAFNQAAGSFNKRNPANGQTKLGYAVKKISESQIKQIIADYQKDQSKNWYDAVGKKQIDLALTDKATGAVLTAPKDAERPYLFDKKGLLEIKEIEQKYTEDARVFFDEYCKKEFDIEHHYTTEIPEDITPDELEAFKGFVVELDKDTK